MTSSDISSTFTDKAASVRIVTYSNMACTHKDNEILEDITYDYNYVLGDNFKTASGKKTTKIDLSYAGIHLSKGTLEEVPALGTKSYTIVYIENNKLFTGDETDYNATSDATRPIAIDFAVQLIKQ